MEVSGTGKTLNSPLSFRYNANNEELEELFHVSDDDPLNPRIEPSQSNVVPIENASPKKIDKSSSLIDKYFKSMRTEKTAEKQDDTKVPENNKTIDDTRTPGTKETSSSPMKEYLHRLSKKNSTSESTAELKEGTNETWKIFHDFKFKIAQAVEDIKTRSGEEVKEKCVPRENSMSDSEENSVLKDSDQQSVGDTDNQVSSLDSSMQNLSDLTQPATAKPTETSLPANRNLSESSDDTHKNFAHSDSIEGGKDLFDDSNMMDVESGIEAFEDSNIDNYGNITNIDMGVNEQIPMMEEAAPLQPEPQVANFGIPPNKNNIQKPEKALSPKNHFWTFSLYFLTFLLFVNYILFPNSSIWNGFLLGIWFFWMVTSFKQWFVLNYLSAWEPVTSSLFQLRNSTPLPSTYTIPSVKEHRPLKKYEGWINHYRSPEYDPYTYHISRTTTAFIKVEGCNLRISYTKTKIAKRALWDEKIDKVAFYQHRLYNLTGARVILLPKGLVRKRQWSKKYPICIILNEKEKIQVLEKETTLADKKTEDKKKHDQQSQLHHEVESTETNTSPEKKKKFVWRRREKSISHSDGESGKEGLRHRFARKMHKEKKSDSVSMIAEPADSQVQIDKSFQLEEPFHDAETELSNSTNKDDVVEEDLDDNDLARIKEFLEEAECEAGTEGASEGEWSFHIKHPRDKSSHLYLFARTGRDKHEWYRRFTSAISEANASADSSAADERPAPDQDNDKDKEKDKDNIEMAVYKISEKETVSFAKKTAEVEISASSSPIPHIEIENYEKTFWPYLYKIIQSHEVNTKTTSEAGVMCQLEPSPHNRSNRKKKRSSKSTEECTCRTLPAEVAWLNAVLARLAYDVMRDPNTIAKVQNRIQRKLHTLKLPSFMSPLVVEALTLRGACPVVGRVAAPAADERGLWLDADVRYDGGAHITILTQINLMKLKEKNTTLEEQLLADAENVVESDPSTLFIDRQLRRRKPAIFDSDVEDSAESSSDDETPPAQPVDTAEAASITESPSAINDGGTSSKKKFLRMVDKIATNKYFQQVTDYKYVKRAMEGLSNTDIRLQLEVVALEGRLALNLPHPPHDRLWIGFRSNPLLVLKARPGVGARALRFTHVSNWIEQRLSKEFEKVLVLPNMEDVLIEGMTPTPVCFN